MGHEVDIRRDGARVTITLDAPGVKNALSWVGFRELRDALRTIEPGRDRVVVLTGAGREFCSGANLGATTSRHNLDDMSAMKDLVLTLFHLPVPTIARVDGVAIGAGMNFALACDLVVATDRARFAEIFVKRGLTLDAGGSWLLPRLVGLHRAKELALFGDMIDAVRAREIGLVHSVVAPEELDPTVDRIAERLRRAPTTALMQTKALLNGAFEVSLDKALDDEARAQTINIWEPDIVEAAAAFAERREPDFQSTHRGPVGRLASEGELDDR
jgi:enoyl-CoA hydratase/carnithine racemase